jgi:hypothetical protein
MPRGKADSDYTCASIYKLVATGTTDVYIGSTCGSLTQRLWHHNYSAAHPDTQKQTASCKLYEGDRTVAIELVELYPCDSKQALDARERWWIENTPNCINTNIPGRDWSERRAENMDEYKSYMLAYRAQKFECECGKTVGYADKARHLRSKFHLNHTA